MAAVFARQTHQASAGICPCQPVMVSRLPKDLLKIKIHRYAKYVGKNKFTYYQNKSFSNLHVLLAVV